MPVIIFGSHCLLSQYPNPRLRRDTGYKTYEFGAQCPSLMQGLKNRDQIVERHLPVD